MDKDRGLVISKDVVGVRRSGRVRGYCGLSYGFDLPRFQKVTVRVQALTATVTATQTSDQDEQMP
ncbi:hypothetical protein GCM10022221_35430 [Actinocorallia aurea]